MEENFTFGDFSLEDTNEFKRSYATSTVRQDKMKYISTDSLSSYDVCWFGERYDLTLLYCCTSISYKQSTRHPLFSAMCDHPPVDVRNSR